MMNYTSKQLEEIKSEDAFVDSLGLHIRLGTSTLGGFIILRNIAEKVKRPADAYGGSYSGRAYCWIIIPLTKTEKDHSFGNQPPKKKNKVSKK
jgi:hypothetical protein